MIISASRRTDIPSYYSDWFYNRIKEGFVLVRNPMNFRQISRIKLTPDVVDGIVFWTKNPIPMLERLDELNEFMYYFQFAITPYGKDIESNLPSKNNELLASFKWLSDTIGADRVIWRFDPILINERYSVEYHIKAFTKVAEELHKHTQRVTISFIDADYRGVKSNNKELNLLDFPIEAQRHLASELSSIAKRFGLAIDACTETIDLQQLGIGRASCIDKRLFEKLLGCSMSVDKDKNQRLECGCVSSIDIGMYNTCRNGCRYCYANYRQHNVAINFEKHNPFSPLMSGEVGDNDKITERAIKSCIDRQITTIEI